MGQESPFEPGHTGGFEIGGWASIHGGTSRRWAFANLYPSQTLDERQRPIVYWEGAGAHSGRGPRKSWSPEILRASDARTLSIVTAQRYRK